jgi:hypothetical protein
MIAMLIYDAEVFDSREGQTDRTMEQFAQLYWSMFLLKLIICVSAVIAEPPGQFKSLRGHWPP